MASARRSRSRRAPARARRARRSRRPSRVEVEDPSADVAARLAAWRAAGFVRALVDGREVRLEGEPPALEPGSRFDLVIDRLTFAPAVRARVAEAVEQAEAASGGHVGVVARAKPGESGARREYSTRGACTVCGFQLSEPLEPRHFSFNAHVGACPDCDGLGERFRCDAELLFSHPERPVDDGAVTGKLSRYLVKGKGYYEGLFRAVARVHKVDLRKPWQDLPEGQRALIAYGEGARPQYDVRLERTTENAEIAERFTASWPGLCGHVDAWHAKTEDPEWAAILEQVMSRRTCSTCEGERLRAEVRAVTLEGLRLPAVLELAVTDALAWVGALRARAKLAAAVGAVIEEVGSRLALLEKVGLGYLTLARPTSTLSGGEARRVRLSASLGSQLVGVCYVLDEPTVGLHPQDVEKLTDALLELRDRGNTVLVVEHDQGVMARADWIVDMGPGAGREGGRVVVSGTPADVLAHPTSRTGAALRGEIVFERSAAAGDAIAEAPAGGEIRLLGARTNNLQGADLAFRFGEITVLPRSRSSSRASVSFSTSCGCRPTVGSSST